jgi:hypothetical protein
MEYVMNTIRTYTPIKMTDGVRNYSVISWVWNKSLSEEYRFYFVSLLFDPDDEANTFFWNISKLLQDYMASHPRT